MGSENCILLIKLHQRLKVQEILIMSDIKFIKKLVTNLYLCAFRSRGSTCGCFFRMLHDQHPEVMILDLEPVATVGGRGASVEPGDLPILCRGGDLGVGAM